MYCKVTDNFLTNDEFVFLKNKMLSNDFPWFFNEHSCEDDVSHYQFIHIFYNQNKRPFYETVEPLVKKINPTTIERIKANCNTKTSELIETGLHQDSLNKKFTSSVFFINDCDGYCKVKEKKVFSKANRLVTFKSSAPHTGSTCTNKSRRVLINLMYIV